MKNVFVFVIAILVLVPTAFAQNSILLDSQVDASGKITVAVFQRNAGNSQSQFTSFAVDVPPEFVAIGGGVEGAFLPNGNFLTASYPNTALSAWLVSTKDHLRGNPAMIKAYAIGIKIDGLTRNDLISHIEVRSNSSSYTGHPDVSVGVSEGFKMLGGGFKVNWNGYGNIATASYPENNFSWRAKSKDHGKGSWATLDVYSIGIKNYIPEIGSLEVSIDSVESANSPYPSGTANVSFGYALSGCGARVNWSGAGNLLWKLIPSTVSTLHGCTAASKDLLYSSSATITTYALGVRVND